MRTQPSSHNLRAIFSTPLPASGYNPPAPEHPLINRMSGSGVKLGGTVKEYISHPQRIRDLYTCIPPPNPIPYKESFSHDQETEDRMVKSGSRTCQQRTNTAMLRSEPLNSNQISGERKQRNVYSERQKRTSNKDNAKRNRRV